MSTKVKTVWVVWQNTDITEGRGTLIPMAVCESETTAKRIGKGRDVQGCDCRVEEYQSKYDPGSGWLAPVYIHPASKEDTEIDEKRAKKEAAIERATALGLTAEEIKALNEIINEH